MITLSTHERYVAESQNKDSLNSDTQEMVDEFLKHLLVCDKCLQENKYNVYPHENIQRFTVKLLFIETKTQLKEENYQLEVATEDQNVYSNIQENKKLTKKNTQKLSKGNSETKEVYRSQSCRDKQNSR